MIWKMEGAATLKDEEVIGKPCEVCGAAPGDDRHWVLEPWCSKECAGIARLVTALAGLTKALQRNF